MNNRRVLAERMRGPRRYMLLAFSQVWRIPVIAAVVGFWHAGQFTSHHLLSLVGYE